MERIARANGEEQEKDRHLTIIAPNKVLRHSLNHDDDAPAATAAAAAVAVMDPHHPELSASAAVAGGDLTSAVLGIIKGMVGPAILYLPHGFAKTGWLVAMPILAVCTTMFLLSADSLLQTWRYQRDRATAATARRRRSNGPPEPDDHPPDDDHPSLLQQGRRDPYREGIELTEIGAAPTGTGTGTAATSSTTTAGAAAAAAAGVVGIPNNEEETTVQDSSPRGGGGGGDALKEPFLESSPSTCRRKRRRTTSTDGAGGEDDVLSLSYPQLAFLAYGPAAETAVNAGISLMQSGVCLTYLIFVPHNLRSSFLEVTGWDVPVMYWLVFMIGMEIPLSWIRDIRRFAPTNLAANVLILYGLITCLGFAVSTATSGQDGPISEIGHHLAALSPARRDWFLFIGTSVLLFEGSITLLIPLQEAVETEQDKARFPAVYVRVIGAIIVFYVFFGITCWMAFGDDVHTVLTTSLPSTFLATTVQLAYSAAVIFTFPLQNFPALEIADRCLDSFVFVPPFFPPRLLRFLPRSMIGQSDSNDSISSNNNNSNNENGISSTAATTTTATTAATRAAAMTELLCDFCCWDRRNIMSSVAVVLLAVVAASTMNSLDKVVSLMGSLLGCPIAFVAPPLIHNRLLSGQYQQGGGGTATTTTAAAAVLVLSERRMRINNAVAGMGVVAMIMASVTTLLTWNE